MKKNLGLILAAALAFVPNARAITVNPASSVTADSAATGLTIPYRDANGDFAVNALTAANLTTSGNVLGPSPAVQTIGAGGTITADACGGTKHVTVTAARTTDTTNTFTAPTSALAGCVMTVMLVGSGAGANLTLDTNTNFPIAANDVLKSSDTRTVAVQTTDGGTSFYWVMVSSYTR